jgi:hypothetical protein
VIELRLHREIYRGTAVDEACGIYGSYATLERAEETDHWAVRVTAASPERERQVAGELANYALGLTVSTREAKS